MTMKKSVMVIGTLAGATLLAAGWAAADSNGFGPRFSGQGMGTGMMGHGMMQGGGGMGHGQMDAGHMGAGHMGHVGGTGRGPAAAGLDPARLDALKAELGITAAQEVAWAKYASAVRDATAAATALREGSEPGVVGKLTPQERFAEVTRLRESAETRRESVRTAANELIATLDEAQRTMAGTLQPNVATATRPGPMRGPMGGDMGRGMHGH